MAGLTSSQTCGLGAVKFETATRKVSPHIAVWRNVSVKDSFESLIPGQLIQLTDTEMSGLKFRFDGMEIELGENLNNYSALAEIFSATTIVFGSIFALVQFREYRKR